MSEYLFYFFEYSFYFSRSNFHYMWRQDKQNRSVWNIPWDSSSYLKMKLKIKKWKKYHMDGEEFGCLEREGVRERENEDSVSVFRCYSADMVNRGQRASCRILPWLSLAKNRRTFDGFTYKSVCKRLLSVLFPSCKDDISFITFSSDSQWCKYEVEKIGLRKSVRENIATVKRKPHIGTITW